MIKSLTPITLATLLALTTPLAAQESETAQTGSTAEATGQAGGSTADQVLDLGQTVGETEPQIGDRYAKETHGDWDLACVRTENGQDPCSLLQILKDPNDNPMAEFSLFRIAPNGGQAVAGATIIVPLETLLPAGISISIDGAPAKRYNFRFCAPIGCVAQIGLTQADIDAFKKGSEAKVSLRPEAAPDQLVEMPMSLKGFTAGFGAVDVVQQ
ncbi:Invasion protein B, involved in pathogenesis [Phaeobacter sp. CECT 5382]|uniref:invasion associated locus B family protein n=1 Tax=Rhodobacterales TaxID=204455 RepID=UPI0006DAD109|nr:invasion associated locus B family protein [Phaeobacter sp. CECT 5382]CUH88692.1 Invasion protein B, involved in pathogenesis [Phaeobacter sp. CECT 5382]